MHPSALLMPCHSCLHLVLNKLLHQIRAHYVLAETLPLQQLEMPERGARIRQVLEIRRLGPVLQVGEVGDKGRLREQLLRREMVEVEGVGERLDKLNFFCFPLALAAVKGKGKGKGADGLTSSSISKRE